MRKSEEKLTTVPRWVMVGGIAKMCQTVPLPLSTARKDATTSQQRKELSRGLFLVTRGRFDDLFQIHAEIFIFGNNFHLTFVNSLNL